MERVRTPAELEHPLVREAFALLGIEHANLEIASMADIPAGTGLGSSGSFTTALLKALHVHRKAIVDPRALAEQACTIEIDRLREPVGKQDQYIAAFGGLTCFTFRQDDTVVAEPLAISAETRYNLEDHLGLFFTGYTRSAGSILGEQHEKSLSRDGAMTDNLHFVKELGYASRAALEGGDIAEFGRLMDVHWQWKKKRSAAMSNARIDGWYQLAKDNGATGCKLIGAGGGGFLLVCAEDMRRVRHALTAAGTREVRFRWDDEGTRVVSQ
jgi:Predicted kinase related to galactokinase and mevalonate kinase